MVVACRRIFADLQKLKNEKVRGILKMYLGCELLGLARRRSEHSRRVSLFLAPLTLSRCIRTHQRRIWIAHLSQLIYSDQKLATTMMMTMFSVRFCGLMAVLLAIVPTTVATTTKTPMVSPVGSCAQQTQAPSIFGVSRQLPAVLSMRGGQVFEPESLQEVEDIILRAGSEQKLVVIDFGATWW
jgi:hypothetical protein